MKKDNSSKNEGVRLIAEFTDRAIRLSTTDIGLANNVVEKPISRSINEGIYPLADFADPVQRRKTKEDGQLDEKPLDGSSEDLK